MSTLRQVGGVNGHKKEQNKNYTLYTRKTRLKIEVASFQQLAQKRAVI